MAATDLAEGLARSVHGAVSSVYDATLGRATERVADGAVQLTAATAEQVVNELEPYLISEAVPSIVRGLMPFLAETVVPEVLAGVTGHLVSTTVPEVIDGVSQHLVERTVPQVIDGVSEHLVAVTVPEIVAGITPALVAELLPRILADLRPYLSTELVPQIVDEMMPHIEAAVAPQLVDSLMPKIRAEVVPSVLDDIVVDPRVRDLIREQSQGLFLDALERARAGLAEADEVAERAMGRVLFRGHRSDRAGAPPGRDFEFAGVVSRALALALDLTLAVWLLGIALSTAFNVLGSLFDGGPAWAAGVLTAWAASLAPLYLAVCWRIWGATLGMLVLGIRLTDSAGQRLRLSRCLLRAWLLLPLLPLWAIGMIGSQSEPGRRGWLDRLLGTQVPYFVSPSQQHRYALNAISEQREANRRNTGRGGSQEG
ncbi:MAG: RDD family protein [Candidatus Nanopelagicales bacterium]